MRLLSRTVLITTATALLATGATVGVAQAAPPAPPPPIVVPVADNPSSIEVSPAGRYAYVTAAGENVVSIIDLATKTLVENVPVGSDPLDAVLDDRGRILYVANGESGTVSVLDTRTRRVTRTITVGGFPAAIDVRHTRTGDVLYVADFTGDAVLQVDAATGSIQARWSILEPADVVITSDDHIVVPSSGTSAILVINARDGSQQTLQRPDGGSANPLAASGNRTVVALPGDVSTIWLNTKTMEFTNQVSAIAPGVTSSSDLVAGGRITLLATRDNVDADPRVPGNISMVRAGRTIAVIPVGVGPRAVAASSRGILVAQGPADNGGFGLLILPWRSLTPTQQAPFSS